jgi:hypothetical protein
MHAIVADMYMITSCLQKRRAHFITPERVKGIHAGVLDKHYTGYKKVLDANPMLVSQPGRQVNVDESPLGGRAEKQKAPMVWCAKDSTGHFPKSPFMRTMSSGGGHVSLLSAMPGDGVPLKNGYALP